MLQEIGRILEERDVKRLYHSETSSGRVARASYQAFQRARDILWGYGSDCGYPPTPLIKNHAYLQTPEVPLKLKIHGQEENIDLVLSEQSRKFGRRIMLWCKRKGIERKNEHLFDFDQKLGHYSVRLSGKHGQELVTEEEFENVSQVLDALEKKLAKQRKPKYKSARPLKSTATTIGK